MRWRLSRNTLERALVHDNILNPRSANFSAVRIQLARNAIVTSGRFLQKKTESRSKFENPAAGRDPPIQQVHIKFELSFGVLAFVIAIILGVVSCSARLLQIHLVSCSKRQAQDQAS